MKNFSLKFKLLLLSGFLMVVSAVIGFTGYISLNSVEQSYSRVAEVNLPNINRLDEMFLQVRAIRIESLQLSMDGVSQADRDESIKRIAEARENYNEYEKAYLSVPFIPGEEDLYNELKKAVTANRAEVDRIVAIAKKNPPDGSPEKVAMAKIAVNELRDTGNAVRLAVRKLLDFQQKDAKASVDAAAAAATFGTMLSVGILIAGIVSGALFAWFFTNSLVKTLTSISQSLADSSAQVTSAATQIASSSEELSQAATEQASSLEETASSIEEMSSMVAKNSENAKESSTVSNHSQSSAAKGKEVVEQMMSSMQEINNSNNNIMNQINESNAQMADIVKVIQEIGSKTKVINDIVFQTKLLSFNASVEAARAGEHGKGFAVVAEEVGNLAQMSGNAAKEISNMLEGSIQKVEGIVQSTKVNVERLVNEGKVKVETGTQVAKQCGEVLNEIVENVSRVSTMSVEISKASDEQARGVQEITKAMSQLDQVTQQNAATSEEAASAAEELSAQADSLRGMVDVLVQTVQGKSDGAPIAATTTKPTAKKPEAKGGDEGKVVHLKAKAKPAAAPATYKKTADGTVPAYNDPRFEDV